MQRAAKRKYMYSALYTHLPNVFVTPTVTTKTTNPKVLILSIHKLVIAHQERVMDTISDETVIVSNVTKFRVEQFKKHAYRIVLYGK